MTTDTDTPRNDLDLSDLIELARAKLQEAVDDPATPKHMRSLARCGLAGLFGPDDDFATVSDFAANAPFFTALSVVSLDKTPPTPEEFRHHAAAVLRGDG